MSLVLSNNKQDIQVIFFAKEVGSMLKIKEVEIRMLAKFMRVKKICGVFYFTSSDVEKIRNSVSIGSEINPNNASTR